MTNDKPIKFGTDGWRGLIADDFTFDNVRRVAGGIASYVLRHEDPPMACSSDMTRDFSPGKSHA